MARCKKMHKLTEKEEMFAFSVFSGMSQTDAYLKAFKASRKWKKSAVYPKASRMSKQDNIVARMNELKTTAHSKRILSFQELQEMLSDKIREDLDVNGLRAADILNRMAGNYEKDNTQTVKVISFEDRLYGSDEQTP